MKRGVFIFLEHTFHCKSLFLFSLLTPFLLKYHRQSSGFNQSQNIIKQFTMAISEETFEKVATLVGDKNTPAKRASTRAEKLTLYGLYKQATVGSERPDRPGIFNIDGRMKWDAWAAEEKLSKDEAREAYCELAKELVGKPVEAILA